MTDDDSLRRQRKAQALLVAAATEDPASRLALVRALRDDPDAPFVIFYLAGFAGLLARGLAEAEGSAVEALLERFGRMIAGQEGGDT
jgi:hypothetical protein